MPYYVYRISKSSTGAIKDLHLLDQFEAYKEARTYARQLRSQATDTLAIIKLIFANDQQEAEQRLSEVREQPVLKEWEK